MEFKWIQKGICMLQAEMVSKWVILPWGYHDLIIFPRSSAMTEFSSARSLLGQMLPTWHLRAMESWSFWPILASSWHKSTPRADLRLYDAGQSIYRSSNLSFDVLASDQWQFFHCKLRALSPTQHIPVSRPVLYCNGKQHYKPHWRSRSACHL